jgi:hypothetical protein
LFPKLCCKSVWALFLRSTAPWLQDLDSKSSFSEYLLIACRFAKYVPFSRLLCCWWCLQQNGLRSWPWLWLWPWRWPVAQAPPLLPSWPWPWAPSLPWLPLSLSQPSKRVSAVAMSRWTPTGSTHFAMLKGGGALDVKLYWSYPRELRGLEQHLITRFCYWNLIKQT